MADAQLANRELTDKLEAGIKELYESDKFTEYLRTMARFHQYSTRNTLLIHMQAPNATRIAGYNAWKNKFNRQVKKGERGIKIFAPVQYIVKTEADKLDPVTQLPVIGEDGQPVRDEIEIRSARFKITTVFDILQTEGDPLPELAETLTGDVERYELFMDALRAVSPLPIVFRELDGADGRCIFGDRIEINTAMSEIQTVCAVVHEITHARLHDLELPQDGEPPKDRRTQEVEAESVSYVVCQNYSIETGANSFGYVAEWSRGRELKELRASLDVIRKTAAALTGSIDEHYHALAKERGIDLAADAEQSAVDAPVLIETAETQRSIIAAYAGASSNLQIGSNVLMSPVFIDGNFNREGKRIRVKVEEPAGKYQLFTRESEEDALYIMTASGRIDRTSQYFRDDYDEENRKYISHRPTEAELDELIPRIAEQFELQIADPIQWASYQYAAVLDRLDECDPHNVPVRKAREQESAANREAAELERQAEQQRVQDKLDARVDEIADALLSSATISVGYDENEYDGKNPVLDLFRLYDIKLPIRTQGWVNTGLAQLAESNYRYYSGKHNGNSSTFGGYLNTLREAIKETPITEKRAELGGATTEVKNKMENNLYEKLAEMFPDFMNRKYSYMKLEATGYEPLSLEWIFGDRISIMHTYTMNGDLMYDPMMEFIVSDESRTLVPTSFEQSMPPLYQYHDDDGVGRSVDGNGNNRAVPNLRAQLADFSSTWFSNIENQGYAPVKALLWSDGGIDEADIEVLFDGNGSVTLPEDKFYVDKRIQNVTWMYYNPDSSAGGQYIINQLSFALIAEAAESGAFYDRLGALCKQHFVDVGTPEFEDVDRGFKHDPYDFGDCTDETMNALIDLAEAGARDMTDIAEDVTEPPYTYPDPAIAESERDLYGYIDNAMLPLTKPRALELFDAEYTIYVLNSDNTEEIAFDRSEIERSDNLFGIERAEWDGWLASHNIMKAEIIGEGSREADLLHGGEDKLGIYQLREDIENGRDLRWASIQEVEQRGLTVDRANYELVYTAQLGKDEDLGGIFIKFNLDSPSDYKGHSLSMSDIIVLQREGVVSSHYIDSGGYVSLSSFTGNEAEISFSQVGKSSDTPTVAEFEADVKAGKAISLLDLSKAINAENKPHEKKSRPSFLDRLEANKQKSARQNGVEKVKIQEPEVIK